MNRPRSWHQRVGGVAGFILVVFAALHVMAEDGTKALMDEKPLFDAHIQAPPLEPIIKRFYRNNEDCVSAKIDLWFWRGRYAHQLFTTHSRVPDRVASSPARTDGTPSSTETWEGDQDNPVTRQTVDADRTTILVGREGCRYRIRIERAQ